MANLATFQTSFSTASRLEEEEKQCQARRRTCQEGISCVEGRASYFCRECGTYQCESCQADLHSSRGLQKHSRTVLGGETVATCELWCSPRCPVSVLCRQCGVEMCSECDRKMHRQGGRKDHVRVGVWPEQSSTEHLSRPESDVTSFLLVNDKEQIMVCVCAYMCMCDYILLVKCLALWASGSNPVQ